MEGLDFDEPMYWLRRTGGTWIEIGLPVAESLKVAVARGWLTPGNIRGGRCRYETTDEGRRTLEKRLGWPGGVVPAPTPKARK